MPPSPARNPLTPVTIHVCTQCGFGHLAPGELPRASPQARALVKQLRALLEHPHSGPTLPPIQVRLSRCLGDCDHPIAYAFTGPEREALLFGNGGTVGAQTIAQGARAYARKRPGTRFQRADIPPAQKGTIYARIPPPHPLKKPRP